MLRLLSKDDVQQLLLVQPQTDAAPGPFFNDGTGQFTVDAPPESTVAIGSNVIQTHAMSTHNLLALVFQVIDVDGSGNCSKSELANSQFGKTLQAGLWKDFRSSELAEWNTMDTDGDGMVSLQEWLRFFQKLKADMEIDDAAFKTFCVDCIQNSWRQATSSAHERTVRLLSFVFLKLVPDDSARTRRKSDLIRSALGVVLAEDEFISSSFAAWALEERGDNPDNAVLCTACGRAVHVGAECGWYHRQGTLEDMCESHFSRLDPEASSTAEFLWVDEASVATAIGSQLADYAELYDREKDNSEPAQLSPAAVELADWLALFFDLQPQLYNPGSETATGYGDDAFDVFVTRLLQQASPQLFVEFTEEEEVFAAVDDLLYQVAHRQAMVEQIEDEEAPEDTIKAVVDELVQHVERINNDMQSSELEPGEQQDGLADTRPIRSQRGQLVVTVEKPPANTAADKFTSEDKKMQDRRRYQKMSKLYQRSVDQGDAQRLCQRAYDLAKRVFGDDHPRTASSANNLGTIFLKQRNYEHARPLLEEALLARRHLLGPADPDTATTTHNLGSLNMELWNFEDAALLLTDAAQVRCQRLSVRSTAGDVGGELVDLTSWPPSVVRRFSVCLSDATDSLRFLKVLRRF
jgi:tetratricopeptide (TPR) repeat protein